MSDFNEELLGEINTLRTNPKKYARTISKYVSYFKGKLLCLPGSNAGIQTEEGASAYREAVDFLSKHSRIDPLKPSKGLCRIAEEFIAAVQKPNSNEIENKDMEEIINKYGTFAGSFSRAMDFGGETPEQAVINLIVSDGDKSRGQRESLLSTEIKRVGVANGRHDTYRHCTAIVTCTEFENTYDADDNGLLVEESPKKTSRYKKVDTPKDRNAKPKTVVKTRGNEDNKYRKNDEGNERNLRNEVNDGNDRNVRSDGNDRIDRNERNVRDEELPPGVVSMNQSEKEIIENGVKKRITRIVKVMDDGSKQIETFKKVVEE